MKKICQITRVRTPNKIVKNIKIREESNWFETLYLQFIFNFRVSRKVTDLFYKYLICNYEIMFRDEINESMV